MAHTSPCAGPGGCWKRNQVELCDSDPASPGLIPCFWVTSWMVLLRTGKPSFSSWQAAAPGTALRKAKPLRSYEPCMFKRWEAWSSAPGSKWRADRQIFKLLLPVICAQLDLALLHLHRATWTSIKTIPFSSFDPHDLIQQRTIICLAGKINADKFKVLFFFFPSENVCKQIWNILWVCCTRDRTTRDGFLSGYIKNIHIHFNHFYQFHSYA